MNSFAGVLVPVVVLLAAGCAATPTLSSAPGAASIAPPSDDVTSPSPSSLAYTWPGPLDAGTYTTTFIWDTPVAVTFTVPDGWESRDVEVINDPVNRLNEVGGPRGRSVMFVLVDNVYADPCSGALRNPPVGSTVDDLADALASLPGMDATPPKPVVFAGYNGKYVELSIGPGSGCDLPDRHLWTTKSEWMKQAEHAGGTSFTAERERYRIWVLDVAGTRYVIAALSAVDSTAADLAELQSVLDSIEFTP